MTLGPTRCRAALLSLLIAACGEPTAPPETPVRVAGAPIAWLASTSSSYDIGLDQTQRRSGDAAAFITSTDAPATEQGSLTQMLRADDYRGRRVRWTGWVRVSDAAGPGAGLWMRVDGPGLTLAYDNMEQRRIAGTSDWQEVSVVLDVPQNAIGISLGGLLGGPGDLVVDDLRLETVGVDVPLTDMLTAPKPTGTDSAYLVAIYEAKPAAPVNAGFEGVDAPSQATVDYVRDAAVPFAGTDPASSDADLEPLGQMVGSARVVGLGEGTHGTREFFRMKHRILEYLVRQEGFTVFAIEATSPESDRVNDYVLEGKGDPAVLLSNLYFWTWNTQEVLDQIEWMRQWNLTAPPDRRVRFRGVDMQYPGMAMDTVTAFVGAVDSANAAFVTQRFYCLANYRNQGHDLPNPSNRYVDRPATFRDACHAGLQEVFDLLASHRAGYEAASSSVRYARALHSARLVQQFEEKAGTASVSAGVRLRDAFMAENALWLLDQAGPDARMVVWAHNGHVFRRSGAMGDSLARALGDAYVNVGFLFGHGGFNAVDQKNPRTLKAWQTDYIPDDAIEGVFARTGQPRLLFDARGLANGGAAADPLRGPIRMRSIGSTFHPDYQDSYFMPQLLPRYFDLLLYVEETTPSTLLPFVYE